MFQSKTQGNFSKKRLPVLPEMKYLLDLIFIIKSDFIVDMI